MDLYCSVERLFGTCVADSCRARLGKAHNHPAVPKYVIELHLFRWACLLRIIGGPESPKEVVEALAPHWPQLSEHIQLEKPRIVSWISSCEMRQEIANFETRWNKKKLREFKQLLQSEQPYWSPLHPILTGTKCTHHSNSEN